MEQVKQGNPSLNKIDTLIETSTDYVEKMHCDTNKWTQPFKCAVTSCPNAFVKYDPEYKLSYKFHNFPTNEPLKRNWITRCKLDLDVDTDLLKVCSDHFTLDDYERNYKEEFKNPYYKRRLKMEAVPTQKLDDTDMSLSEVNAVKSFTEPLPYNMTKAVVDENVKLKDEVEKLKRRKMDFTYKIKSYNRKYNMKTREVLKLKAQLEKLKKNTYGIKDHKNLLSCVFSDAQVNILLGKKKVIWSEDDLAMAFSLRQMSSKECYLYLKHTLNLPLPALSCVQKWAASK